MQDWKIAYILLCIVIITYMIKYEYEWYYHQKRKELGREAQLYAAEALLYAQDNPSYSTVARQIAFLANQAGTTKSYKQALLFTDETKRMYNEVFFS